VQLTPTVSARAFSLLLIQPQIGESARAVAQGQDGGFISRGFITTSTTALAVTKFRCSPSRIPMKVLDLESALRQ
jgi:hypothetical protein